MSADFAHCPLKVNGSDEQPVTARNTERSDRNVVTGRAGFRGYLPSASWAIFEPST